MKGTSYIPLLIDKLKQIQPEKIILFGSYAYGEPSEDSDIDILVVTSDNRIPLSFAEKSRIYLRVSRVISGIKEKYPVDLIVHTKAMHNKFIETNSLFAREILTNGKILYEKDNKGLVT
ncbi:MAG: nucleotidyltransferase domain-containing protein [Bacteroidales bacterium]|nr:nucleotidyltransferase domain-containing protein [Bacteroidales bacterium]